MQQPIFMHGGLPMSPTMQPGMEPMQPMPMQMMPGQMMPMQMMPYPGQGQVMTMMPGGMMMPVGQPAPAPGKVEDVEGGDAIGEVSFSVNLHARYTSPLTTVLLNCWSGVG